MVEIDGEPWFVAADVLGVLYPGKNWSRGGSGQYLRHLDWDTERQLATKANTPKLFQGNRGQPCKTVINESGLYKLIMRSDKPEARAFCVGGKHTDAGVIRTHPTPDVG